MAEAVKAMAGVSEVSYEPNESSAVAYDALYTQYRKLYDLFGRELEMMHDLHGVRVEALSASAR
ncbi:hypothetical protein [Schaalia hyovaginalis]|uniref:hypothetical protein n=1 Tax=Schaalia hyovaginalis TaxID=29316 RepID=UPI0026F01B49|nr:hypothetical protein [Schaalia hyovaginalis]MCI6410128.1 hypothetical protein [Schaalia hyovaginalis]MCI6557531.1 hypothetical protein [Schaalia hyovaginalis]MDY3094285.1 hypothetical protein [Schaalia hyovaginalis]MDY3666043.1 hypothetical protein [Schaalia hyovaginalis]MDY6213976.1 hypothetical protein [Schaalia hyovaginalis]